MDEDDYNLDDLLALERDTAHYAQLLDPLNHAAGEGVMTRSVGLRGGSRPCDVPHPADRDVERLLHDALDDDADGSGDGGETHGGIAQRHTNLAPPPLVPPLVCPAFHSFHTAAGEGKSGSTSAGAGGRAATTQPAPLLRGLSDGSARGAEAGGRGGAVSAELRKAMLGSVVLSHAQQAVVNPFASRVEAAARRQKAALTSRSRQGHDDLQRAQREAEVVGAVLAHRKRLNAMAAAAEASAAAAGTGAAAGSMTQATQRDEDATQTTWLESPHTGESTAPNPARAVSSWLLDRPPFGEDSLEVALPDGELHFLRVRAGVDRAPAARPQHLDALAKSGGLLPVPIAELRRRVAEARLSNVEAALASSERVMARAAALASSNDGGGGGGDDGGVDRILAELDDDEVMNGTRPAPGVIDRTRVSTSLWVDRYAPRSFADLLSSETVNRNVLKWIRLWDDRVFGPPASAAKASGKGGKGSGGLAASKSLGMFGASAAGASGPAAKRGRGDGATDAGVVSSSGGSAAVVANGSGGHSDATGFGWGWKADARVLLLCGAPGTGKTTLVSQLHITSHPRHARVLAQSPPFPPICA